MKPISDIAPTILSVRESPSGKHIILTVSSDSESGKSDIDKKTKSGNFTVSLPVYRKIGMPGKGECLSDCQMTEISEEDERFRATKQAIRLLAYADQNEKNLSLKLQRKGFSKSAAEEAVHVMVREGYLNEQNQLERLIASEANAHLFGPNKITQKLTAKGYARRDIISVIRELVENGTIDFAKNRRELLTKHLKKSQDPCGDPGTKSEEIWKLLYRFGYTGRE